MKKASNILTTITIVLGFVGAGAMLFFSPLFFVLGSPACTNMIAQGIENGLIRTSFRGTIEMETMMVQITYICFATIFFFLSGVYFALGIVALKKKRFQTRRLSIAMIVLSALTDTPTGIVAGIFDLVLASRDRR